ncbi:MAG: universal stress protein [Haloarculaceae archaeon]
MAKHLLVPLDGGAGSDEALSYVLEEFPEARVTLFHVINPARASFTAQAALPSFSEEWYEEERESAERLFETARERVPEGTTVETETEVGRPAQAIVRYADEHDVDGIVMGSHGREGVARVLLGSVAETVVRRSPVPVTVVR